METTLAGALPPGSAEALTPVKSITRLAPGQVLRFSDLGATAHETATLDLRLRDAVSGGGGSVVPDDREGWDATFAVCGGGSYACTRALMARLVAASEGHVVNASSVNGFWAS